MNARGGVLGGTKLELVTFDSKGNPQEALLAFKQAVDQGIRYIEQTNGSNVAVALFDAVNKNNARDPDHTVLYMNTRRSIRRLPTTAATSGTSASTPTPT